MIWFGGLRSGGMVKGEGCGVSRGPCEESGGYGLSGQGLGVGILGQGTVCGVQSMGIVVCGHYGVHQSLHPSPSNT